MAKKKKLKASDIIDKVDVHYDNTESLRQRMEDDYSLYRLDPYDAGDGYQSYTSNAPQTYADKVISWIVSSEMVARIPNIHENEDIRFANNNKEKVFLGMLRSADERLKNALSPSIKNQLAFYISIRGWYAGRALLTKRDDGTTYVDISPWDPMHTYWGVGADGLAWACHKIQKGRTEIEEEYGVRLSGEAMERDDEDWLYVYDYYDKEENIVVVGNGQVVKKATAHGSPRVPVFIGPVGSTPPVQALAEHTDIESTVEDFGESVFKSSRDVYEKNNFMMSIMLELTARARRQGLKIKSRDGSKTLDEDPYKEGTEISLAQGEDVEPLGLLEMSRETQGFMGVLTGDMQRGTLPHSIYGDLQFQLSGFAINTLRQGIDSVLQPRIEALEDAYMKMCMLLCDQYMSGNFRAMELSGRDMNRTYFSEIITPESIEMAKDIEINFVGQLPQDDMSKMSMAQIAREGPNPLLPDIFIRDKILGLQDTDTIDNAIKEQEATELLPEAKLFTLMQSAEERGRDDLAQLYLGELLYILKQKMMMRQQQDMQSQQMGMQGGQGGAGPTADPRAMPNAGMGVPPPTPTPQAGPLVPPNSPRPNARGMGPL
tara:strand:+ start:119 stop:1921 length:1803 start_codon:yes stop_codon:yes gene_type:complete